jgi:hypothetical protein
MDSDKRRAQGSEGGIERREREGERDLGHTESAGR